MGEHLYREQHGRFLRALIIDESGRHEDATVDASLFGVFYFDCFAADDPKIHSTMNAVIERLTVGQGLARFENDDYMRSDVSSVGNAWFICSVWLAEYYIACAKLPADLEKPLSILEWIATSAFPSGVLAEQLDPHTGQHLSVSPLTWSHSTFVAAVHSYLNRSKLLNK
jgi:GH15 family glucan-1,4-alpha-glucosidase